MASGRIVVTTGPERGKVFEIEEELVHVGRAVENQIVLDDPSLSEHQASILNKNGRFAIYRPDDAEVNVDGNDIPAEQWVWLPSNARLQFGLRTTCQFSYEQSLDDEPEPPAQKSKAEAEPEAEPEETSSESQEDRSEGGSTKQSAKKSRSKSSTTKQRAVPRAGAGAATDDDKSQTGEKRKKKKRKRQAARFITDQGNPLVELGADGQLPELMLDEGTSAKRKSDKPKQSSPALMYGILAFSFLSTIGMLLFDVAPVKSGSMDKVTARTRVQEFYGDGKEELRPFHKKLRAAQLARSRREYGEERRLYLEVLNELNSEDRDLNIGVTGSLQGDVALKELIGILISQ
jgi:hypothetical protein